MNSNIEEVFWNFEHSTLGVMKWALVWLIWIYPRSNKQTLDGSGLTLPSLSKCLAAAGSCWLGGLGLTWTQPIRLLQTAAAGCCSRIGWVRIDPASAIGWVKVDLDPANPVAAICNVYLVHLYKKGNISQKSIINKPNLKPQTTMSQKSIQSYLSFEEDTCGNFRPLGANNPNQTFIKNVCVVRCLEILLLFTDLKNGFCWREYDVWKF